MRRRRGGATMTPVLHPRRSCCLTRSVMPSGSLQQASSPAPRYERDAYTLDLRQFAVVQERNCGCSRCAEPTSSASATSRVRPGAGDGPPPPASSATTPARPFAAGFGRPAERARCSCWPSTGCGSAKPSSPTPTTEAWSPHPHRAPQGRQGRHHRPGTPERPSHRPCHRRASRRADLPRPQRQPARPHAAGRIVRRLGRKAGINGPVGPHTLRHGFRWPLRRRWFP